MKSMPFLIENRVIDLENKLKESEMNNEKLDSELKALAKIQKLQDMEISKILGNQDYETKIKELNEEIKNTKLHLKDQERKLVSDSQDSQNLHEAVAELKSKYQKLKDEKEQILKKSPSKSDENEESKKCEIDVLEASIQSIQKTLKFERAAHRKNIDNLTKEKSYLLNHLKEAEQERKVGVIKVSEVQKTVRHNQLKPLRKFPVENNTNKTMDNPKLSKMVFFLFCIYKKLDDVKVENFIRSNKNEPVTERNDEIKNENIQCQNSNNIENNKISENSQPNTTQKLPEIKKEEKKIEPIQNAIPPQEISNLNLENPKAEQTKNIANPDLMASLQENILENKKPEIKTENSVQTKENKTEIKKDELKVEPSSEDIQKSLNSTSQKIKIPNNMPLLAENTPQENLLKPALQENPNEKQPENKEEKIPDQKQAEKLPENKQEKMPEKLVEPNATEKFPEKQPENKPENKTQNS